MPRRIPRDDPALAGMSQADHLQVAKQVAKYVELFYIRSLKKELRIALRAERNAKRSLVAYGPNWSRDQIEGLEDLRMELEGRIEGTERNFRKVTRHFSPGWEKTV
jgi:hypothetical protein